MRTPARRVAALTVAALSLPAAPASAREAETCKRIEKSLQIYLTAAGLDAAGNKWASAYKNMQAVKIGMALYTAKDC